MVSYPKTLNADFTSLSIRLMHFGELENLLGFLSMSSAAGILLSFSIVFAFGGLECRSFRVFKKVVYLTVCIGGG